MMVTNIQLKVNPSNDLLYAGFNDNVCIIDTNAPEDDQLVDGIFFILRLFFQQVYLFPF